MDYLALNHFDLCFKLLKDSESLLLQPPLNNLTSDDHLSTRRRLLSLTFNNLGCYYKK